MLEVESVDWHLLENGRAHHTDRYEILHEEATPVLRRAQPFKITLTFRNRPFNEATDRVRLLFTLGKGKVTPRLESIIDSTTVSRSNKLDNSKELWSLEIQKQDGARLTLLVRGPPTAAWGVWHLTVKSSFKTSPKTLIWKSPKDFYLLFNPWAAEDEVYMADTRYLDEYVLNDVGKVYTSSAAKPIGMKWVFGQFAAPVLKVLRKLIEAQELDEQDQGSPVQLCYSLARNVGDIIQGNWSGTFTGGTPPWLWTGSIPIYEEYLRTEQPVKYGQCFIYSAIYTTALRAVGIPARSVTNFVSATGGYNMAVNNVFDKEGNSIDSASIWNFHVWNDAWMARYDLIPGFGGWQATDATGGEGPAPVEAIKRGDICQNFGVRDVLAEVNADRVRWTVDDDEQYHLVSIDTKHIGRSLLTKQPFIYDPHGDTDFEDVVHCYKEPEGSKEERMALYNAIKECRKDDWGFGMPFHIDVPSDEDTDISFEIQEIDSILFGDPLNATVNIKNGGDKKMTVECCIGVSSMYYNGAVVGLICRETKEITLQAKSKASLSLTVKAEEYSAKLVEFTQVRIHCIATVLESNYTWANDHQLTIDMPELLIQSKQDLEANKEGVLQFQFHNSLSSALSGCSLNFEAAPIARNITVPWRNVKAGEEVNIEYKITPTKSGEIPIKAIFRSKQLSFLGGSSYLQIL